jgi:hypothetical protein
MMDTDAFLTAVFLATLNSKLVDLVKQPVQKKWPELDLWWFTYVSVVTGLLLGWLAQINLLAAYIPNQTAGVIVSGLAIGGGSWFLYEAFMDRPGEAVILEATVPEETEALSASLTIEQENK